MQAASGGLVVLSLLQIPGHLRAEDGPEKIRVTGSRIKRTEMESSNPVRIIDRDEIEASGFTKIADLLRVIPSATHGALKERSGRGAPDASGTDIRGLGEEYTLVLLNGRRLANDPLLEYPDVNQIPLVAIERVEIMKEGASAVYGSDAIGGVVNIITRRGFSGSRLLISRDFTSEKGGEENRVESLTGISTGRGDITFSLSWRDQEIIMNRDREYSSEGWSPTGSPGSYRTIPVTSEAGEWVVDSAGTKGNWTAAADCPEDTLHRRLDAGNGNSYCQFNYAQTMSIVPKVEQLGLMLDATYRPEAMPEIFFTLRGMRRSTFWTYAPAPQMFRVTDPAVAAAMGIGIDAAANQGVEIRYRTTELGNRDNQVETHVAAGTVGLRGEIGLDWEWEFSVSKNRVYNLDKGVSGYWLISRMQDLIAGGQYNPLDPDRDKSVALSTAYQTWSENIAQLDQIDLVFSGEVMPMAGGDLSLAVGTTAIEDYYLQANDSLTVNGEVAGSAAVNGEGHRQIKSWYVEMSMPPMPGFEINLALRHDVYSDLGEATSPRIGLLWRPTDTMLLRFSAGRGFRAPSLQALTDTGGYGYPNFIDVPYCEAMRAAGNATAAATACSRAQYEVETLAAQNLAAEKSRFATLGTVVAPISGLDLGLDLWYTEIEDRIAVVSDHNLQALMQAENDGVNLGAAGITVSRDKVGALEKVVIPNINMSVTRIAGIDFNYHFRRSFGIHTLSLQSNLSWFYYYKEALFEELDPEDTIGNYERPRWKMNTSLGFSVGPTQQMVLSNRLIAGQKKANPDAGDLPSNSEYDFQYTYNGSWDGSVSVGVTNLLNEGPPIDETANPKVDSDLYNVLGRKYYLKITQNF